MTGHDWPWCRADALCTGDLVVDFDAASGERTVAEVAAVSPSPTLAVDITLDSGQTMTLPADMLVARVREA
jgi:hypothetical protein